MVSLTFGIAFLLMAFVCMALFALADIFPRHRTRLAILATVAEAFIFLQIAWLFYNHISWEGIPNWLMALLGIGGSLSTLRMMYKRAKGLPL